MIKIRADKEDQIVIIILDSKEMFLTVKPKLAIYQKKMLFPFQLRRQSRHGFRSRWVPTCQMDSWLEPSRQERTRRSTMSGIFQNA
jgi:hypothetical protein